MYAAPIPIAPSPDLTWAKLGVSLNGDGESLAGRGSDGDLGAIRVTWGLYGGYMG